MMQRAALAVAQHARELEDAPFAAGQQLFAGEFRRGRQVAPDAVPRGSDQLGRECMQVRLVAGRSDQCRGLHLYEVTLRKELPECSSDPRTRKQHFPPFAMAPPER